MAEITVRYKRTWQIKPYESESVELGVVETVQVSGDTGETAETAAIAQAVQAAELAIAEKLETILDMQATKAGMRTELSQLIDYLRRARPTHA